MQNIHTPERLQGESQLAYRQRQKISRAVAGRATSLWPRRKGTFWRGGGIPLDGKLPASTNRQQRRAADKGDR